jgi:hypothetical protein
MAGNPDPSPEHRFTAENNPGRGRQKGALASTVTKKVNAKVEEKLHDMLGKAHLNIKAALNKRDVKTSMWLIDKLKRDEGTQLKKGKLSDLLGPLANALDSLDDVETISKAALLLAIDGDMNFEELKAVQEALARHSVLAGVIELGKLREEVAKMSEASAPSKALGNDHMPDWGKLKDITPVKEPQTDGA